MITRNYVHRTFGNIGSVEFGVPKGKFTLNGKELPESSVEHLMTFALQTLQDAYAGAKTADEAVGSFGSKLDRIIAGTLGTRSGGGGVDERTRVARSVVHAAVKAKFGSKSADWATFTGLSQDEQNAKLDGWFAANEAAFTPAVDAEMERRAAKRADRSALTGAVDIAM